MTGTYLEITTMAFIIMRMTGMIMTNPYTGRSSIPMLFKGGLILALSILIYSYTDVHVPTPESLPEYVLLLLKEFIIGVAMSMVVNLATYVIAFAGEQMDMQMGLSMSAMYDQGSNISMAASGNFYNVMLILTFFSTNAFMTMIRLFIDSAQLMPYGSVVINAQLTNVLLDLFCQATILGVKMALPLIALELMVEIAVGVIMKAVPQINIFVINIQIKMIVGFIFLILTFQPMADFIEIIINFMFDGLKQVMTVM